MTRNNDFNVYSMTSTEYGLQLHSRFTARSRIPLHHVITTTAALFYEVFHFKSEAHELRHPTLVSNRCSRVLVREIQDVEAGLQSSGLTDDRCGGGIEAWRSCKHHVLRLRHGSWTFEANCATKQNVTPVEFLSVSLLLRLLQC